MPSTTRTPLTVSTIAQGQYPHPRSPPQVLLKILWQPWPEWLALRFISLALGLELGLEEELHMEPPDLEGLHMRSDPCVLLPYPPVENSFLREATLSISLLGLAPSLFISSPPLACRDSTQPPDPLSYTNKGSQEGEKARGMSTGPLHSA